MCRNPVFPETFIKEAVFSPSYIFGTFIKDQDLEGSL
jgi:hypothetical protein